MKGTYRSSYLKPGGRRVIIYTVTGTVKEKEDFAATQTALGITHKDGDDLIFFMPATNPDGSYKPLSQTIDIIKTGGENPRFVIDNMAAEFAISAKEQEFYAQELAKARAQKAVAGNGGTTQVAIAPTKQEAAQPAVTENAAVAELENAGGTEDLG